MSKSGCLRWSFTSFDVGNPLQFDEQTMNYLIYGRERCPVTGRWHLQGFVCFKERTTKKKLQLLSPKAHFESTRSSVLDNIYCKKGGDYSEFGCPPLDQWVKATESRRAQYENAVACAKLGQFDQIDASILLQNYSNIQRIRADEVAKKKVSKLEAGSKLDMWLGGAPGLGKSFFARQFCYSRHLSYYVKPTSKWWDGYEDEDIVIMEDIDHSSAKFLSHLIKIWCNEGPFRGETKGGYIHIRPRGFIVTSNYKIDALWPKDITLAQAIGRRFLQPTLNCRDDFQTIKWDVTVRCLDESVAAANFLSRRRKAFKSPPKSRQSGKVVRFLPAADGIDGRIAS